jgi:hypothetical protein
MFSERIIIISQMNGKDNVLYIDYAELANEDDPSYIINNKNDKNNGKSMFKISKSQLTKSKNSVKKHLYNVILQKAINQKEQYKIMVDTNQINKINFKVDYNIDYNQYRFINFEFITGEKPLYAMVRDNNDSVQYFKMQDQEDTQLSFLWYCATPCLWQYKYLNGTLDKWVNSLPKLKEYLDYLVNNNKIKWIIPNRSPTDLDIINKYEYLRNSRISENINMEVPTVYLKGFFQEVSPVTNKVII